MPTNNRNQGKAVSGGQRERGPIPQSGEYQSPFTRNVLAAIAQTPGITLYEVGKPRVSAKGTLDYYDKGILRAERLITCVLDNTNLQQVTGKPQPQETYEQIQGLLSTAHKALQDNLVLQTHINPHERREPRLYASSSVPTVPAQPGEPGAWRNNRQWIKNGNPDSMVLPYLRAKAALSPLDVAHYAQTSTDPEVVRAYPIIVESAKAADNMESIEDVEICIFPTSQDVEEEYKYTRNVAHFALHFSALTS